MRVALTIGYGKISPAFDTAEALLLVPVENRAPVERQMISLDMHSPLERVEQLRVWQVNTLICGAISEAIEKLLVSAGVHVVSEIRGPVEVVLGAFLSGQLKGPAFEMPDRVRARPFFSGANRLPGKDCVGHLAMECAVSGDEICEGR